jgi:cytochrome c oxidase cbb3-type subunit 3
LTDKTWIWGGSGEQIEQTIAQGRMATMPAHASTYSEEKIWDIISYVGSLGGKTEDPTQVASGKVMFEQSCFACHGIDGKGNTAMGAPDLTDDNWLYGGARIDIEQSIAKGRHGIMPGFKDRLGADKVHILAGYIYSLSLNK